MHLKNLSRLRAGNDLISSAPVHDLVATRIVLPADKEEMAKNTDVKFAWAMRKIVNFVDMSFLSTPLLEESKIFLTERGNSLDLRSGRSLMGATSRRGIVKLSFAQRSPRNLFTCRGELELETKCPSQYGWEFFAAITLLLTSFASR